MNLPIATSISGGDIFRDLAPAELAQLKHTITVANYTDGHIFFSSDERGEQLFLLQAGRVRLYKLSPEGRALTLAVLEPPNVFGEMSAVGEWFHDSYAEAMSDCAVGVMKRADLRRSMEQYPQIALRLMELMAQRLHLMEKKLSDIAFKSVPQRLASLLLSLITMSTPEGVPASPPAVMRYTHQQLAEMIGSYRETVTKAIGDLRDSGIICIDEETIYLTDLPRLQALAGR